MKELLGTTVVQHAIAFFVSGLLGILVHYFVKWQKGEIKENLLAYLFISYPNNTFGAVIGLFIAEAGAFALGALDTAVIGMVVGSGFLAGYSADSAFNKAVV